jgi:hypothetical protein
MLDPAKVCVADWWRAEFPALIFAQKLARPVRDVERRVGEDEIKALIREGVFDQCALRVPAQVSKDAANGEVHAGKAEGGVVAFLPIDRDIGPLPLVCVDEFLGLNEKATRAAAGVIDAAFGRLDHRVDDRFWGVEFAAAFAFGACEFRDKVFVDAADEIKVGAVAFKFDVGEQINQASEHAAVDCLFAKDLGQGALQAFVVNLDRAHGVVDHDTDAGVLGVFRKGGPSGLLRNPEYVFGKVFVAVFRIREFLGLQFVVHTGERNGDVTKEEQAKGEVFVFTGIHCAPHFVSGCKKGAFDAHDDGL